MSADLSRVFVCDVESTCWETREEQGSMPNEVIEIGICVLDRKQGIIDVSSYVIKPAYTKVSPFCTQLTGWTQEAIDEGATMHATSSCRPSSNRRVVFAISTVLIASIIHSHRCAVTSTSKH